MRGFIEHDSFNCLLGEHSNRGPIRQMCPVYLELRRARIRGSMRRLRSDRRWAADVNAHALFGR